MGGASSFYAMLAIAGFLSATWCATKFSKLMGLSSIVLEITTGVVLGPRALGLIGSEYAVCVYGRHGECEVPPDFGRLVAQGLSLGEYLDHAAKLGYCDPQADGGLQAEPSTTPVVAAPTTPVASSTTPGPATSPTTRPTTSASSTLGAGGAAGSDQGDALENETRSANGTGSETAGGGGRLLSTGGGGGPGSYGECLQRACEAEISHQCGLTPDIFTLIGHAGVALMIFESGMHFDFEQAKVVGLPACAVAVLGTLLPLASGSLLAVAFGKPLMPQGISAGTVLAPTSVGIALRLLGEVGVLQESFGQAIITAAFVDDILSLVLFNVLFSLGSEFNVWATVVSPIAGIALMLLAMAAAVRFWPWFLDDVLLRRAPEARDAQAQGLARLRLTREELLFVAMMCLLVLYAFITHLLGTHLWGCFIAGMSFACLKPAGHAHHVWARQTKRITTWMVRIFFACTVAFSIPIHKLVSVEAFWKGTIMGIGPCILAKVCCAPFMGRARWVIGWAMVGRAEFAYLIAQMAAAANMLDDDMFAICIWALLYATIFAPLVFRVLLRRYVAAHGGGDESKPGDMEEGAPPSLMEPSGVDLNLGKLGAPEGAPPSLVEPSGVDLYLGKLDAPEASPVAV